MWFENNIRSLLPDVAKKTKKLQDYLKRVLRQGARA